MRLSLVGLVLLVGAVAARAETEERTGTVAEPACLSSGRAQEAVTSQQVVTPGAAIMFAREAVPNADVLRAALCRDTDALVYRIVILRRDGRLVQVTVDAPSGKVKTVH